MIPSKPIDYTNVVLKYLRSSIPGVKFSRTKTTDSRCVVVDTEPIGMETPITRRVTVLLETWSKRANGNSHPSDSYDLMASVLYWLQRMPESVAAAIRFDSVVGPRVEKDANKFEYHEGSIVLVFS